MAQPPNRGFDPSKLIGLAGHITKIVTLGKPAWGALADALRDAATRNDAAALDLALENLGTAFALLAALETDMQSSLASISGQLGGLTGRLNSLEARVTALERRP